MKKESFGQRLSRLRKEKGLTQEDIANRITISPQAVSKWENDVSSPDIDYLNSLADILDVSVDVLLGRKESAKAFTESQNEATKEAGCGLQSLKFLLLVTSPFSSITSTPSLVM